MNICPFCLRENEPRQVICVACGCRMYTQPLTEWGSQIDQVAHGYRSGRAKGVTHGVQKDAVQNAWGARRNGGRWRFRFCLVCGADGAHYLAMTDEGTTGLTGHVFSEPNDIPDTLPAEERLARFENMNFSGGNQGPGLYGRGKLIFQAASQRKEIIYDSLTEDGDYRLGRRFQEGRRLNQFPCVLEGEAAAEMLERLTGRVLAPLEAVGTRVTIVHPLQEIIDAFASGDFLSFVEETWWEILLKRRAEIVVGSEGQEVEAQCPDVYRRLAEGRIPES